MAPPPTLHDRRHRGWFWIENNLLDVHGPRLGATGIAIYALLARHADQNGQAFPSLHRFQRLLGLSRNTVKKYLKILASPEVKLIRILERTTLNGDADSHIYELLNVVGRSTIDLPGSTIDLPGSTIDRGVGQPLTGGRSTIDKPVYKDARVGEGNPIKETHLKEEKKDPPNPPQMRPSVAHTYVEIPESLGNGLQSATKMATWDADPLPGSPAATGIRRSREYTPGFLAWWSHYPTDRRISKPACFAVWQQHGLEARVDELCEKLDRLKETTWGHCERKYIKTSLPYLNSGRYDDDLMPLEEQTREEASDLAAIAKLQEEGYFHDRARNVTPQPGIDRIGQGVQRGVE